MHRASAVFLLAALLTSSFAYAEEINFVDPDVVANTQTCESLPGTVLITDKTRPAARATGVPDDVYCWKPNDANMGVDVGEAKVFLRSIVCPNSRDNYGGAGSDETIQKLNPKFAVCAARFLKAASAQMSVCINEGYRTEEKQREYYDRYRKGTGGIACNPSATQCEHPRGIAIDVNTLRESDYQRLWQMAPQFGLSFYMGAQDKYHFVPKNADCASIVNGSTGSSVPTSLPVSVYDFPRQAPTANPFQDPNLTFMMPILQQLAQPRQQAPQYPLTIAPTPAPQPQLLPTTPVPTPNTPTPTPTNPSPQTPIPFPTTPTPTSTTPTSVPQASSSPAKPTQPSWIDIILGYADYGPGATATSTPAQLTPGLSNTSGISPVSGAATSGSAQGASNAPLVPRGTQTFVSNNLANNPSPSAISREETSRLLSALAQLRAGLERLLGMSASPRPVQHAARWYP